MKKYHISTPVAELLFDFDGVIVEEGLNSIIAPEIFSKVLIASHAHSINIRIITNRSDHSKSHVQKVMTEAIKNAGFDNDCEFPEKFIHCVGEKDISGNKASSVAERKVAVIENICSEHKWDETERSLHCLFFDDNKVNVDKAKSRGIPAYLVKYEIDIKSLVLLDDVTRNKILDNAIEAHFNHALLFIDSVAKRNRTSVFTASLPEKNDAFFKPIEANNILINGNHSIDKLNSNSVMVSRHRS